MEVSQDRKDDNLTIKNLDDSDTKKDVASTNYIGRELSVGDLVHRRTSLRSRKKSSPYWDRISVVTERVGDKTYVVCDGKNSTRRNIDGLKDFSLGEDLIRQLQINLDFLVQAENHLGKLDAFDIVVQNF